MYPPNKHGNTANDSSNSSYYGFNLVHFTIADMLTLPLSYLIITETNVVPQA